MIDAEVDATVVAVAAHEGVMEICVCAERRRTGIASLLLKTTRGLARADWHHPGATTAFVAHL